MNAGPCPAHRREPPAPDLLTVLRVACLGQPRLSMTALPDRRVRWAVETGLGPLLARVAAREGPAPTSPPWSLVHGANLTARYLAAQHLGAMTEILDACSGEIPPPVLLKGISFCDQHYPEAHLRPMRDIDFLLEGDSIPVAESILRTLGYRQWSVRPTSFYDGHHHSCPFVHAGTGIWVDVHRALVAPREQRLGSGILGVEHVMTQLRWSEFRGRRVRRLSAELQIVHLAYHWARGLRAVGGMVAMADMAFILKTAPPVDWDRILGWVDASPAARALCVLLTYLDKHRVIDLAPEILQRLCEMRRSPGRLTLRLAHALLDRYVVNGQDFGMFMSERTFNRLWKLLILGSRPVRRRVFRPGAALRTAPAAMHRPAGAPGLAGGASESENCTSELDAGRGGMTMKRSAAEAGRSASLHPNRRSDLRARSVEGEVLILDRQRQLVHHVNQTARFIWDRCDGEHTVLHIASELARVFDVDLTTAERDVAAAIRQLEAAGLVEPRTDWAPAETQARRVS